MKKVLLLIMALSVIGWAQLQSYAPAQSPLKIMDDKWVVGSLTGVYSDSFALDYQWGALSIFLTTDTTRTLNQKAATQSDSNLTVIYQIKDNLLGWSKHYNDVGSYTKIDTIDRAFVNVGGSSVLRIDVQNESATFSPGDFMKVGVIIGVGDSLKVNMTRKIF